jgi:nitroreductase
MHPVPAETILSNLNWRYATKKFDAAKKIPDAQWKTLEQALILAPSSYGLQPWRFVVVANPAVRAKLREVAWNQPQITDASHLVVLCRNTKPSKADVEAYMQRIAEVRGVPRASLDGYFGMIAGSLETARPGFDASVWTSRQVYIALGFFLSTAAHMGIDACPMEGFDAGKFDEILGLAGTNFASTVVVTAGYRAADDASAAYKKVRMTPEQAITRV